MSRGGAPEATVDGLKVGAFTVPTQTPESDGTLEWSSTTLVVVEAEGGGARGLGYSYADVATAKLVEDRLAELVRGTDAFAVGDAFGKMVRGVRNLGATGIAAMAISAVDTALWDLKARLLRVSLASLFGPVRDAVPVYGSGGFTSYDDAQLRKQLGGWAAEGIAAVKMKVGREPERDLARVRVVREAIGPRCALFVDANGGYTRKQALELGERFAEAGVRWFEEPVSSDDLEGLRLLRDRLPAGIDVSAGEYAYGLKDFRALLDAGAVDVLQADATRCLGYTGFLKAAALAEASRVPLSTHCAPALHLPVACAASVLVHSEYFFDHVRIERALFDGVPPLREGALRPDLRSHGNGLTFKWQDAQRYAR